ncbi:hypothetical protein [Enterobacter hormaechei]
MCAIILTGTITYGI